MRVEMQLIVESHHGIVRVDVPDKWTIEELERQVRVTLGGTIPIGIIVDGYLEAFSDESLRTAFASTAEVRVVPMEVDSEYIAVSGDEEFPNEELSSEEAMELTKAKFDSLFATEGEKNDFVVFLGTNPHRRYVQVTSMSPEHVFDIETRILGSLTEVEIVAAIRQLGLPHSIKFGKKGMVRLGFVMRNHRHLFQGRGTGKGRPVGRGGLHGGWFPPPPPGHHPGHYHPGHYHGHHHGHHPGHQHGPGMRGGFHGVRGGFRGFGGMMNSNQPTFMNPRHNRRGGRNSSNSKDDNKTMARLVKHVTIPDRCEVSTGSTFEKTWTVRNDSDVPWPQNTLLEAVSGDFQVVNSQIHKLPDALNPGFSTDITVSGLVAPAELGFYSVTWRFKDTVTGETFGQKLWCEFFSVAKQ